jgi:hypothetical protein
MLINIYITQADAIREGSEEYGELELDVDLPSLSQTERECLARLLEGDAPDELLREGRIVVRTADPQGLVHAIEAVPFRSSRAKELDELFAAAGSPAVESDREKLHAIRDALFSPLDEWPRYSPAKDVEHSPCCTLPKASFRVEDSKPDEAQRGELGRILRAARDIEGKASISTRLHKGLCSDCGGWARLYGALVEITTPAGNHFSRELALQPPSQTP